MDTMPNPKIVDDDKGEISAMLYGKQLRGWFYKNDAERRLKMQMAHEFAEGWFVARERLKEKIDLRLNAILCEMTPGYDDSVAGFNEAWDVVSKVFSEDAKQRTAA